MPKPDRNASLHAGPALPLLAAAAKMPVHEGGAQLSMMRSIVSLCVPLPKRQAGPLLESVTWTRTEGGGESRWRAILMSCQALNIARQALPLVQPIRGSATDRRVSSMRERKADDRPAARHPRHRAEYLLEDTMSLKIVARTAHQYRTVARVDIDGRELRDVPAKSCWRTGLARSSSSSRSRNTASTGHR